MKTVGNTILITGGGSGIGRGLAEAFHALGNHVIIAGRRKPALDQVTAANPGMTSLTLDIEDSGSIRSFAAQLGKDYPALNILQSGTRKEEKLLDPKSLAAAHNIRKHLLNMTHFFEYMGESGWTPPPNMGMPPRHPNRDFSRPAGR